MTVRKRYRRPYTVAQAKNVMRRAVREIVDPSPRSLDEVWEFFDSSCAYCGRLLDRALREAHMDHLDAEGGNHLGNFVLACRHCNGDHKRDKPWREFIRGIASGPERADRVRRIEKWQRTHPRTVSAVLPPAAIRLQQELDDLCDEFATKCTALRQAIKEGM